MYKIYIYIYINSSLKYGALMVLTVLNYYSKQVTNRNIRLINYYNTF